MNKQRLFFTAVIAAFFLTGCSNSSPELKQIYSQINFRKIPVSNELRTEFVVLVNVEDEDGEDDIESIHVINEELDFFWTVDRDNWSSRSGRGMKWLGTEKFQTEDGGVPAPGEYRVLVTDRAGERVEDTLFISLIKEYPEDEDFPQLVFSEKNKTVEIMSPEKRNILSFYDSEGNRIGAFSVTPGLVDINRLNDGVSIMENFRSAEISYYNNKFGTGLISGPFIKN